MVGAPCLHAPWEARVLRGLLVTPAAAWLTSASPPHGCRHPPRCAHHPRLNKRRASARQATLSSRSLRRVLCTCARPAFSGRSAGTLSGGWFLPAATSRRSFWRPRCLCSSRLQCRPATAHSQLPLIRHNVAGRCGGHAAVLVPLLRRTSASALATLKARAHSCSSHIIHRAGFRGSHAAGLVPPLRRGVQQPQALCLLLGARACCQPVDAAQVRDPLLVWAAWLRTGLFACTPSGSLAAGSACSKPAHQARTTCNRCTHRCCCCLRALAGWRRCLRATTGSSMRSGPLTSAPWPTRPATDEAWPMKLAADVPRQGFFELLSTAGAAPWRPAGARRLLTAQLTMLLISSVCLHHHCSVAQSELPMYLSAHYPI